MKCLESLRQFDGQWQLILVQNGQELSPATIELAKSLTSHLELVFIENKATPGAARNRALDQVIGDWIFFLDDDAYLLSGYNERIKYHFANSNFDVIGGPDIPAKGMTKFSTALALTLASPFCTGLTHVRHEPSGSKSFKATELHLSSCNLWIKKLALNDIRFPEDFTRTEEIYLLTELKKEKKNFLYDPKLKVGHFRRKKMKDLLSPTFFSGFYRSKLMRRFQQSSGQFWLPAFFVLFHFIIFVSPELFAYLAQIYLCLIVMMALKISIRNNSLIIFLHVIYLHYFIVFIYGLGFLYERIKMHASK